jgi:hypothetical protein
MLRRHGVQHLNEPVADVIAVLEGSWLQLTARSHTLLDEDK